MLIKVFWQFFFHSTDSNSLKLRCLSIWNVITYCLLLITLTNYFIYYLSPKMLMLKTRFSWFNFILLFWNHSTACKLSCSSLLIRNFRYLPQAKYEVSSEVINLSRLSKIEQIISINIEKDQVQILEKPLEASLPIN